MSEQSTAVVRPPPPVQAGSASLAAPLQSQALSLSDWFGTEFSLIDAATGDMVRLARDHAGIDWGLRAELCRETARRGRAEIIEESEPCLVLALPLPQRLAGSVVAVGVLLTSPAETEQSLSVVASVLGVECSEAPAWCRRQRVQSAAAVESMAELAMAKLTSDQSVGRLQGEVEKLSNHLAATYEEISLLYRLTQNLKLSRNDEDLGRHSLEWLAAVVPAEGLALMLTTGSEPDLLTADSRTEPVLLSHGNCPVDLAEFLRLADTLQVTARHRPLVMNRAETRRPDWSFAGIRELVVVPLAEGDRLFGWLAAFNHNQSGEFGTVEASLLASVGTILGIHSGNIDLYRQQAELLAGIVRALTSAIDAKDPYTRGHSDRVARIAVRLGQELQLDAETLNTIYLSGLLHDVGKIGINDEVLRKPGKLSEAEFEHIKTHVTIGYRILSDLRKMANMLPVVLHHHESWDGGGYPQGLAGEAIPYLARIVAVADAYDAMASDRPYRPGMAQDRLEVILRDGAGRQWDPQVVDAFMRAVSDIKGITASGAKKPESEDMRWY